MAKKVVRREYINGQWVDVYQATTADMVIVGGDKTLDSVIDDMTLGYTRYDEEFGTFTSTPTSDIVITNLTFVPGRDNIQLYIDGKKLTVGKNFTYDGMYTITKVDDGTGAAWNDTFGDYCVVLMKLVRPMSPTDGIFDGNQISPQSINDSKLAYPLQDKIARSIEIEDSIMDMYRKEMRLSGSPKFRSLSNDYEIVNFVNDSEILPTSTATFNNVDKVVEFSPLTTNVLDLKESVRTAFTKFTMKVFSESFKKAIPNKKVVDSKVLDFRNQSIEVGDTLYDPVNEVSFNVDGLTTGYDPSAPFIGLERVFPECNGKGAIADNMGNIFQFSQDSAGQLVVHKRDIDGNVTDTGFPVVAGYGQEAPSAVVDSKNNLHVVWHGKDVGNTGHAQIKYSKYNGVAWSAWINLSLVSGYVQGFARIVCDANDSLYAVWHGGDASNSYSQIKYSVFTTSWSSWANLNVIAGYHQYYPTVAISADNSLHVVWQGTSTGVANTQIKYSKFDGSSWSAPINISPIDGYSQSLPGIVIGNDGKLHVAWYGQDPTSGAYNRIKYSSFDGSSWSAWINVATMSSNSQTGQKMAIDGKGDLHLMWTDSPVALRHFKLVKGEFVDMAPTNSFISECNIDFKFIDNIRDFSLPPLHCNGVLYGRWNQPCIGPITEANYQYAVYVKDMTKIICTKTDVDTEEVSVIGDVVCDIPGYNQYNPNVVEDSLGNLHVIWRGYDAINTNKYQIKCSKFNGTSWSPWVNIAEISGYHQYSPAVLVDRNDNLRVIWSGTDAENPTNYQIKYSEFNGEYWSHWINLSVVSEYAQQGPKIAMDSKNNLHVVWCGADAISDNKKQIKYIKFDGTRWSDWMNIAYISGYDQSGVNLEIDSNDNLHAVWCGNDPTNSQYAQVKYCKYDGIEWSNWVNVSETTGYNQQNASLVVDIHGTAHVVWCSRDSANVSFTQVKYSRFNGTNWTPWVNVSLVSGYSQSASLIKIDASGQLRVYWLGVDAETTPTSKIKFSKMVNSSWIDWVNVTGNLATVERDYAPFIPKSKESISTVQYQYSVYLNGANKIVCVKTDQFGNTTKVGSNVCNISGYTQSSPKIEVDSNGNLHVIWYGMDSVNTTKYQIKYSKFDGTSWSPWVNIAEIASYSQYSPDLVIDSDDNLHVVWHGIDASLVTYTQIKYTKFNGTSWSSFINISAIAGYSQSLPEIKVDSLNNIHVVWYGCDSVNTTMSQNKYSKFNGTSWSAWVNVGLISGYAQGAATMVIDSFNNIHLVWAGTDSTSPTFNQIKYSKFNGTSWSAWVNISTVSATAHQYYPNLQIDSYGNLHVIWHGLDQINTTVSQIKYSKFDGTSWSPWVNIVTIAGYAQQRASLQIQPDGRMLAVWCGNDSINTVLYVVKASRFNGVNWEPWYNLVPSSGYDQLLPLTAQYSFNQRTTTESFDMTVNADVRRFEMSKENAQLTSEYVIWAEGTERIVCYKRFSDGYMMQVGGDVCNLVGYTQQRPSIVEDSSGNLHAIWYGTDTINTSKYQIKYSKFNGTSWSAWVNISVVSGYDQLYPNLTIDSNDNLHVVWTGSDVNSSTLNQIKYSKFNGTTWSAWVNISVVTGYSQSYPIIKCGSNLDLHVIWSGTDSVNTLNSQIKYSRFNGTSWSVWVNVSVVSGYTQYYPSVDIDSDYNLHLVWTGSDSTNTVKKQIKYSKFDGTIWSTWVNVLVISDYDQSYPDVNIDNLNSVHVVCQGYDAENATRCQIKYSKFDGVDWLNWVKVNQDSGYNNSNPSITVDGELNVLVTWHGTDSNNLANTKIKCSKLNGSVWSNWTNIATSANSQTNSRVVTSIEIPVSVEKSPPTSVVKDSAGNLYIINTVSYKVARVMMCIKYDVKTKAFINLNMPKLPTLTKGGANFLIDKNDNLHVVYHGQVAVGSAEYQILYIKYDGSVWTDPVVVSSDVGYNQAWANIAIDSNDNLHVVWHGYGSVDTANRKIKYSKFNGTSWSSALNLGVTGYVQYYPSITIDGDDNIHVVWYGMDSVYNYGQIKYTMFNGTVWSDWINLTTAVGQSQLNPKVISDGLNSVHVIWLGYDAVNPTIPVLKHVKYDGFEWSEINTSSIPASLINNLYMIGSEIFISASYSIGKIVKLNPITGIWVELNDSTTEVLSIVPVDIDGAIYIFPINSATDGISVYSEKYSPYVAHVLDKVTTMDTDQSLIVLNQLSAKLNGEDMQYVEFGYAVDGDEYMKFTKDVIQEFNANISITGSDSNINSILTKTNRNIGEIKDLLPPDIILGYEGDLVVHDAKLVGGLDPSEFLSKSGVDKEDMYSKYVEEYDANLVAKSVIYKRKDSTIHKRSVLSGGTSPNYTVRTVTYYEANGVTVKAVVIYDITYTNGNFFSEVIR